MATKRGDDKSNGQDKSPSVEFAYKLISPQFLLGVGIVTNLVLIVEGIVCFSVCTFNFRSYILSFYYILFGILTICAECKLKFIEKHIQLLSKQIGRGFWYIFLGTIALGEHWWAYACAAVLLVCGVLNICGGLMSIEKDKREKGGGDSNRLRSESDNESGNEDEKGSIAPKIELAKSVKNVHDQIKPFEKAYDNNLPASVQAQNAYDEY